MALGAFGRIERKFNEIKLFKHSAVGSNCEVNLPTTNGTRFFRLPHP